MKKVILYTDGGCRGNGQSKNALGAIGGILLYPEKNAKKEYCQAFPDTTNNQMELTAVITGLKMLKEPCEVTVYSDSAYVTNAFKFHWIDGWKQKNWTRGQAGELKNKDLWIELDRLTQTHKVIFEKVKGHANDEYNNRADFLVNQAMDEYTKFGA